MQYLAKIDVFSVGYSFLYYFHRHENLFKNDILYVPLLELFKHMTDINPEKQYSLKDSIKHLKMIYNKYVIKF